MEEHKFIVVLVTTNNAGEAQQITAMLLEQHQAACVNIVPKVDSHFWWEDKLDSAQECLLIIKSKASQLPEIIDLVRKTHSYAVPEIIALPIIGGSKEYLDWIDKEVA